MTSRAPVLQLDIAGNPQNWLSLEGAAKYIVTGDVAWSLAPIVGSLSTGVSRMTGQQTILEIPSIIATRGKPNFDPAGRVPALGNDNTPLFQRDRHMCAFCGDVFKDKDLSREHIVPKSKGGKDTWMNLVTACVQCNNRRGNRSYQEMGLKLLYVPYEPNLFEDFLLRRGGKTILADQMEFLMARVPRNSRLHA
jgi:hypothetical protein